jgi:hypothetical protein
MAEMKSKTTCSFCGGELEYDGPYHDLYHRFEQYRCRSCRMPVQFDMDPLIKEEFPEIKEISIEVLNREGRAPNKYDMNSHVVLLCCWNHMCTNQGVRVGDVLREMLTKHETHREYWEFCNGVELSPQGRKRTPCNQSFRITINIVLKN